jgi:predicted nucleic acid-binding Zn ribbon protein
MNTPPEPPTVLPRPKFPSPEERIRAQSRRGVLAEWRRVDMEPLEQAWANRTRSAAGLVSGVLKGLRLDQRKADTEVVKVWNRLLDPNIAAHAQPVGLRKGTLFVHVDNSVWLTEIVRYRQREILTRLQSSFGSQVIQRISFRLG